MKTTKPKKLDTQANLNAIYRLISAVEGFKNERELGEIAKGVRADWKNHEVLWHVWETTDWLDDPAPKKGLDTYTHARFGIGGYQNACLLVTINRIREAKHESYPSSRVRKTWRLMLLIELEGGHAAYINCETGDVRLPKLPQKDQPTTPKATLHE